MSTDTFTYDWSERSPNSGDFLTWFLPNVLTDPDGGSPDNERFEQIAKATDDYRNVEVGITINGIPVNAKAFLDGVERNMHYQAQVRAQEIVRRNEKLFELDELVGQLTDAIKEAAHNATRGTELEGWDDRDRW